MAKIRWVGSLIVNSLLWVTVAWAQDRILIAETSSENETEISSSQNESIPEHLLIQMSNVPSASEFLRLFVASQEDQQIEFSPNSWPQSGTEESNAANRSAWETNLPKTTYFGGSYGKINVQIPTVTRDPKNLFASFPWSYVKKPRQYVPSPDIIAQPASCQPELHVVELDKAQNGLSLYWPSCVRVRRCGGCCTSKLLACRPIETSYLNVTVLQMKYNLNTGMLETQGTKSFSLEQHNRCSCSCRQQREDCNPDVHEYKENECKCACRNNSAVASCTGPKWIWDKNNCICKCRNVRLCSSGRYFNILTCRCEIFKRSQAVPRTYDYFNTTVDSKIDSKTNSSRSSRILGIW